MRRWVLFCGVLLILGNGAGLTYNVLQGSVLAVANGIGVAISAAFTIKEMNDGHRTKSSGTEVPCGA